MNTAPIAQLTQDLAREFARDVSGARAAAMLSDYARAHADWRRFALFDPEVYTRNLVARNEHFEMLVLCWSSGQQSPIHNHAGQNCWMAVLDGEMEETLFELAADGRALKSGAVRTFRSGRVAYINDDIALHRVRPVKGSSGISLHLYSKPIDACNVYDEQSGQVLRRRLSYHSIEGELVRA